MIASPGKGNDPERWGRFLRDLDEKMQLGLLDHLRRINSYHFEGDELYLEAGSSEDFEYLSRDPVQQQLQLLAQDAVGTAAVKVKGPL